MQRKKLHRRGFLVGGVAGAAAGALGRELWHDGLKQFTGTIARAGAERTVATLTDYAHSVWLAGSTDFEFIYSSDHSRFRPETQIPPGPVLYDEDIEAAKAAFNSGFCSRFVPDLSYARSSLSSGSRVANRVARAVFGAPMELGNALPLIRLPGRVLRPAFGIARLPGPKVLRRRFGQWHATHDWCVADAMGSLVTRPRTASLPDKKERHLQNDLLLITHLRSTNGLSHTFGEGTHAAGTYGFGLALSGAADRQLAPLWKLLRKGASFQALFAVDCYSSGDRTLRPWKIEMKEYAILEGC